MVRREGTPVRRHRRADPRRAPGRAAGGGDPPRRGHLLRRGGRDRALPGAPGVLRRNPRTGSTTRSSAGGRTPTTAGSTPTTRCTTATRWRCGSAPSTGAIESGGLRFHRLPGHELDLEAHSTLFSGEQSNSSVAFGEDALMKVFRKVTPGVNPDIEVHEVLTRAGSEHVAALYGWLDVDDGGRTLQLAMLQQFLRTASDGWDLALASVRSPVRGPRGACPRLRRRLRRRVDPARRGAARGARGPARPLPLRDPPRRRGGRARRDHDRTARGRAGRRTRAGGARHARCGRRSTPSPSWTAWTSSGSTATCTSARPCAPHMAGRSSTSRASRSSRWPSGCCRTRRGATWRGCCAASTTPPGWSSGR